MHMCVKLLYGDFHSKSVKVAPRYWLVVSGVPGICPWCRLYWVGFKRRDARLALAFIAEEKWKWKEETRERRTGAWINDVHMGFHTCTHIHTHVLSTYSQNLQSRFQADVIP